MKNLSRLTTLLLTLVMLLSITASATTGVSREDLTQEIWNEWSEDASKAAESGSDSVVITTGGEVIDQPTSDTTTDTPIYESTESVTLATAAVGEAGETNVSLSQYGKVQLSVGESGGQWQINVADQWVAVSGESGSTFDVTFAKVQSLFQLNNGVARIRWISADAQTTSATAVIGVTYFVATFEEEQLESSSNYALRAASPAVAAEGDADVKADASAPLFTSYSVVINYMRNGSAVATSYSAQLSAGANYSATVKYPVVTGYAVDTANILVGGEGRESLTITTDAESISYSVANLQGDVTITIPYMPVLVNYTVNHYLQNVGDDGYTLGETVTKQALTESIVPAFEETDESKKLVKTYDGFYALWYEPVDVAADGSTVVNIYYDRNYYLMLFNLDGGYGVEPIYARYGARIENVDKPTKAGYTFAGWSLNGTSVENMPTTMPAENSTYKALWTEADSSFTVVYWLENADDEGYSVFGSYPVPAKTGDGVNGEDYKNYNKYITPDNNFKEVEPFIEYEKADLNVKVEGDKSTVVNVYYTRKAYTLKFYYAMEDTTNEKYYVIGGSSYFFGKSGTNTANSIENITNYYMDGGSAVTERGQVDKVPTLNTIGSGRGYTTGYDTASKSVTTGGWWDETTNYNYKYYYISFNAKYGADISAIWPCNVFNSVTRVDKDNTNGWSGEEAFVSAWNGEHHVYYSQHNANQTIKGNYNQLDTQLLWDYAQFGSYADTNNTVDFLCFWENGANVSWSVPILFRYQVWVPVVEGQNMEGLTTKTKAGVIYYLRNTYDTVDNSDAAHQTAPRIKGLTYTGTYDSSSITNPDTSLYKEAYEVNFYYTRNQYNLMFQNNGAMEKTELVPFEADISGKSFPPSYPSTLEAGGYEFEGWYTTSTCAAGTKFDFSGKTMPANALMLYAKWVPVTHTVEFYLDKEAMVAGNKLSTHPDIQVAHGSKVAKEIADPKNGGYTFVTWFYMDGDVEKAFDFENMPVNQNLKIYAKWSAKDPVEYTIKYVIDGTNTEIAERTTGKALPGSSKTFEAKVSDALNEAYRTGYFPVVPSHTLEISINANENVYAFEYVRAEHVPYTVKYWIDNGDGTYSPAFTNEDGSEYIKVVADNTRAVVTEPYKPLNGYMPDAAEKRLILSVNKDGTSDAKKNNIIFYYTKDELHAYYTLSHYYENLDGTYTLIEKVSEVGEINMTCSHNPHTDLTGYEYVESKTEIVVGESTTPGTSAVLTSSGLEIKHYYDRTLHPYTVKYLEQGTNEALHDERTVKNVKYGQSVSENAVSIDGYTGTILTQALTIGSGVNEIIFYYTEDEVTINYVVVGPNGENDGSGTVAPASETVKAVTGTAFGSTAAASSNTYKFVGWYSDAECKTKVSNAATYVPTQPDRVTNQDGAVTNGLWPETTTYYAKFEYNLTTLTIKKSGCADIDAGQSFLFRVTGEGLPDDALTIAINGDGSETISGLTVGQTYTVTEIESWSWRYSATSKIITLGSDASKNVVVVNNDRDKTKWLDGDCYAENVFGSGSSSDSGN